MGAMENSFSNISLFGTPVDFAGRDPMDATRAEDEEHEATAYHEAGHAVVGWKLRIPVHSATINPDHNSLGHVLSSLQHADLEDTQRGMFLIAGELAEKLRENMVNCWNSRIRFTTAPKSDGVTFQTS